MGIVEEDFFVGRCLTYKGDNFLCQGLTVLPSRAQTVLRKKAKKIGSLHDPFAKERFLLQLEKLKTKSAQYSHIEPSRIFDLDNPPPLVL